MTAVRDGGKQAPVTATLDPARARASPVLVMCSVFRLKFPRCSDRCLSARAGRGSGSEGVISGQRSAVMLVWQGAQCVGVSVSERKKRI